ncbi:transcription initiation factor TFIID component TAF4 [Mycena amicta]|nr:transcription initiation factor TFIID component TAF4 [Mycena amicta]
MSGSGIPIDPALRSSTQSSSTTPDPTPPTRIKLDRTRNGPLNANFDIASLKPRLDAIAAHHKLSGGVPEITAAYLAAALRVRLEQLVKQMRDAANHRTDTQFDRPALYAENAPMWSLAVRSDVGKQTAVLEKLERDEEQKLRRERKERAEMTAAHAAALAAQATAGGAVDFEEDGDGGKRKKKKDGPGVTARNMSEDVRKKMSNAVASQAAGIGGKYSWMNATNAAAAAAKPIKNSAVSSTPSTPTPGPQSGGGWARAYTGKKAAAAAATPTPTPLVEEDLRTPITLRDAQFVLQKART